MSKSLNKIFLSLLISIFALFSLAPFQLAKGQQNVGDLLNHKWYSEQDPFVWYQKVYDSNISPDDQIFGERYTAAQVQWVIYGVFSFFWNFIPGNPELTNCLVNGNGGDCSAIGTALNELLSYNNSNTPTNTSFLSILAQNPISGVSYTKRLFDKFKLITPIYAQTGFGYDVAGNAVVELWKAVRNIAFSFAVPVILILAFMIMFRVKISPQVVISIQSAIPKLIITLILVTFSYAIAGFAVDIMYIFIALIAAVLSQYGLSSMDPITLFTQLTTGSDLVRLLWAYELQFIVASFSVALNAIPWGFIMFLFSIIAILVVLFWTFKIVYLYFKYLALIFITIIIGPLEILLGAVTNTGGFSTWIKRLFSQLAVFPIMCLFFFLAFFFLYQGRSALGGGIVVDGPFGAEQLVSRSTWQPPLSPIVGQDSGAFPIIMIGVSFAIFAMITKIEDLIKSITSGKPFSYGSAIGEAMDTGGRVAEMAGHKMGPLPGGYYIEKFGQMAQTIAKGFGR